MGCLKEKNFMPQILFDNERGTDTGVSVSNDDCIAIYRQSYFYKNKEETV